MQKNEASDKGLHLLFRDHGMGWASRNLGLFYNPVCIQKKDLGLKQTNFTDLDVPIPAPQCLRCILLKVKKWRP